MRMCIFKFPDSENAFPYVLHLYVFLPVWVIMCLFSLDTVENAFPHLPLSFGLFFFQFTTLGLTVSYIGAFMGQSVFVFRLTPVMCHMLYVALPSINMLTSVMVSARLATCLSKCITFGLHSQFVIISMSFQLSKSRKWCPTCMTSIRLLPSVCSHVLFQTVRIVKCPATSVTFMWLLSSVCYHVSF